MFLAGEDITGRTGNIEAKKPKSLNFFSKFFEYGQVIETFRGKGIFQPAIDNAIEKLNRGEWVRQGCRATCLFCSLISQLE